METDPQRAGYALGVSVGRNFRGDELSIDVEALTRGVRDGFSDATLALSDEQIETAMQQLQQSHAEKMQAKQEQMKVEQEAVGVRNTEEGKTFLASNGAAEGVSTTASGLQYKIVTAGTGPKPAAEDTVKVHYRGTLIDGSEFDSSYGRGEPVSFPVNAVIPGWVEALQLMPVGSKWELVIPAELAYGPGGAGGKIGPNAVLKFEVELLAIEEPQKAGE
jgi:FKBP-type peptidyl-prolyl cis-trans isomerase FklB